MYYLKILVFCWTFSYILVEVESDLLKGILLGSSLKNDDDSDETEIIVIRIPSAKKKRASKRQQTTTTTSTTTTTTTTSTTTPAPTPSYVTPNRPNNTPRSFYYSNFIPSSHYGDFGSLESLAQNTTAKPITWTQSDRYSESKSRTQRPSITSTPTSLKTTTKVKNVCGANQTFTHCLNECGNTCDSISKNPVCTLQCYGFGCTCAANYVRDELNDRCVVQQDCPQKIKCPVGERFYECGGCKPTCDNPIPVCHRICKPKGDCDCAKGLVRNIHGKCVPYSLCSLSRSVKISNRSSNNSTMMDKNSLIRELLKSIQQKSNENKYKNTE